jgi:hypothetical protein
LLDRLHTTSRTAALRPARDRRSADGDARAAFSHGHCYTQCITIAFGDPPAGRHAVAHADCYANTHDRAERDAVPGHADGKRYHDQHAAITYSDDWGNCYGHGDLAAAFTFCNSAAADLHTATTYSNGSAALGHTAAARQLDAGTADRQANPFANALNQTSTAILTFDV